MLDVNEIKTEGLKCLTWLAAMNASLSVAKIEVVVRLLRGALRAKPEGPVWVGYAHTMTRLACLRAVADKTDALQ